MRSYALPQCGTEQGGANYRHICAVIDRTRVVELPHCLRNSMDRVLDFGAITLSLKTIQDSIQPRAIILFFVVRKDCSDTVAGKISGITDIACASIAPTNALIT